ncbi:PREDICTED: ragulator complex protein LAMTOR2-like [Amphimedon queenslandica]|uniref:Roadblock/LAMTOR2 domain-containing protein n=1 Tax=Amphimedon queenslandica TaxID=400682 RepID=A0A1X7VT10_AMPQE|nr:PREDICTED: ragulator complex protein LAMTOR2-like [Amphimedon queenslandica]|eukprot:XP_003382796.1 PREDICTED: ragulator complex protein LAMTOR2-like [Amphimedon queenslandica]
MLKPKALTRVLEQANTGGIHCTLLLNQEGSLMAFAGKSEKKEHVTAAIAANIWMSYDKNSNATMEDKPLELIVLQCEDGCVAIKKVANLLLCIYAQKSVGLGLLKVKMETLAGYLKEPLSQIAAPT